MSARKRLATVWVCALTIAGVARADAPPTPRTVVTNKKLFTVPIRMADADRAAIRAIKIYVKAPGANWALQETAKPNAAEFSYSAKIEGEHLFSFATEDLQGRQNPVHPEQETPKLIISIDMQPPEVTVNALSVASGQTYLQCQMRDANPEPESLCAEYQKDSGEWTSLVPLGANMPGVFRCPATGLPSRVRVSGRDKAGNTSNQMVALSTGSNPSETMAAGPAVNPILSASNPLPPMPPVLEMQPTSPSANGPTLPMAVPPIGNEKSQPSVTQLMPRPVETHFPAMAVPEPRVVEKPALVTPVPAMNTANVARQVVNTKSCSLAYSLDGIATQSIQRVEAYATRDEGKTWFRVCEDLDRISPIELMLPDDGVYGIVVMVGVTSRPGGPPAAGEQPDCWIEVDCTPPDVRLDSAQPGVGTDAGLVQLNWTVRDRNPAPDSVEVAWSHQPDGPWITIAKGLRSEGTYRWPTPREAGSRAYLKVEATDRAGNVGKFITPQPVIVESPRPRARVLGINPAAVGTRP